MANEFVAKNGLIAQNNSIVTGSLIVTNGITGSLFGTSSQAVSASYTATSSYGFNAVSASYAYTASSAVVASASLIAVSSSYAYTASSATNAFQATSASYAFTASSASTAFSASYAQTASFANNFTVANQLTAQTIVVTTVSSSVVYSSGSNIFGNNLGNTQVLTGSVGITGSLTLRGDQVISGSTTMTGSLLVSGSVFVTSSISIGTLTPVGLLNLFGKTPTITIEHNTASVSAGGQLTFKDNSFATRAVGTQIGAINFVDTGNTGVAGINITKAGVGSSNIDITRDNFGNSGIFISGSGNVGIRNNNPNSASLHVSGNIFAQSFTGSVSGALFGPHTGSLFGTASWAINASSSLIAISSSYAFTASSATNAFQATSASYAFTASSATNAFQAISSSYAFTASSATNSTNALTASYVNTLNQNVNVSGAISIYVPNGPNASIINTNTALILQGAAGGAQTSKSELRITANAGMWTDQLTASYFQIRTTGSSSNNNVVFMGGTYGADSAFDRLQFVSNYSQFTNATNGANTIAPTASFEVLNQTSGSVPMMQLKTIVGQTANYINVTSGSNSTPGNIFSVTKDGIVAIGTTNTSTESNLFLGGLNANEGGQLTLQPGLSYASGAMLDNYQDRFRLLRGNATTSDAEVAWFSLSTKQFALPAYNSATAFTGSAVANLSVDASGNVITVAAGTVTSASYAYTASSAVSSSYALTASYVASIAGLNLAQIATGSVTASVGQSTSSFQVVSGSVNLFYVSSSGFSGFGTVAPRARVHASGSSIGFIGDANDNFFGNYTAGDYIDIGNLGGIGNVYLDARGTSTNVSTSYRTKGTGNHIWTYAGGAVETMRINGATGNLGVGITNPSAILHVSGSGSGSLFQISSHVSSSIFYVSGSGAVGVGLTNPNALLHVKGNHITATGLVKVESNASNLAAITFYPGGTYAGAIFGDTTNGMQIGTNTTSPIIFYVNAGTNEKARITTAGMTLTGSLSVSGSEVITGSLDVAGPITGSNILATGTLTAQTLVVTTVSSSVVYSSGSNIFGNSTANTQTMTGSLNVSGSATIIGRVTATDLTGSLFGTASWATAALTASFAPSYSLDSLVVHLAGTETITGAKTFSGGVAFSSGIYNLYIPTSQFNSTLNSQAYLSGTATEGRVVLGTGNGASTPAVGSNYATVVVAQAQSYQNQSTGVNNIVASLAVKPFTVNNSNNNITNAATLYIDGAFASASNNYGIWNTGTSRFDGNTIIGSGSYAGFGLDVVGTTRLRSSLIISGSQTTTGSFALIGNQSITGSLTVATGSFTVITGSGIEFQVTAQGTKIGNVLTDVHTVTGSLNITGSTSISGSFSVAAGTGTSVFSSNADTLVISGSLIITGSGASITGSLNVSNGITGSLFGTASWAQNAVTASYLLGYISPFPFTGSAQITGSLGVTGSVNVNGSLNVTGSLTGSDARFSGFVTVQSASFDYGQNTNVATGSYQVIASELTSSYRAAFFDYVMFSGSVVRAGTVTSTWSGGAVEFNESYTNDLSGSTAGVILQAALSGGNIQLQATASSQAWTIRSLIRLL